MVNINLSLQGLISISFCLCQYFIVQFDIIDLVSTAFQIRYVGGRCYHKHSYLLLSLFSFTIAKLIMGNTVCNFYWHFSKCFRLCDTTLWHSNNSLNIICIFMYVQSITNVMTRVHNIRGRVSNRLYTLYKCTASSNTSKLSYTLGFNLRVIMDDTTVNRWW